MRYYIELSDTTNEILFPAGETFEEAYKIMCNSLELISKFVSHDKWVVTIKAFKDEI